jgi:SOS-response transcriptional repressor LexA
MIKGQEIRRLRKEKGWTQQDLARKVGVAKTTVLDWEKERYSPEGQNVINLARALGVSVSYIMGESSQAALPKGAKPFSLDDWYPVPLLDPTAIVCAGEGNGGMHGIRLEAEKRLVLPREWIGIISVDEDKKPFAIRVEGESMVEAGIPDGAEIVVNPAEEIRDGDVCLVCYGVRGDWAVKWVHFHPDGSIELRASSPKYPPKRFSREDVENGLLKVLGKVTFVKVVPKRNE